MNFRSLLVYYFVRLLNLTYRYEFLNPKAIDQYKGEYIFSLWHQNLIGAILGHTNKSYAVIVSASEDGQLVANTCERLGHHCARGSSSRQGIAALKSMLRLFKMNIPGAISVDGPQGPAKIAKRGIFELALLSNRPIICLSVYANNAWFFKKSWDQFCIPWPFSRIAIHYSDALWVQKTDKNEQFSQIHKDLAQQMEQGEELVIQHFS